MGELIAISTPAMAGFVKETSLQVLVERGPTVCGSPEQVVDKMGMWRDTLGLDVYLAMCDLGGMPAAELDEMIELMGSDVLPAFQAAPAARP